MEPTNIRFGGGSAATVLHPLVGVVLLATIALIFLLPRKYVLVPLLSTAILVPFGQVVVVVGIHFTVYRILVLFGLVRLMTTRPTPGMSRLAGGLNGIDRGDSVSGRAYDHRIAGRVHRYCIRRLIAIVAPNKREVGDCRSRCV